MWEVSRWRGVRGEENSDVGGVKAEPKLHSGTNAEFPMESLNEHHLPDPHGTCDSEVRWR